MKHYFMKCRYSLPTLYVSKKDWISSQTDGGKKNRKEGKGYSQKMKKGCVVFGLVRMSLGC